jgi:hypothetical protein
MLALGKAEWFRGISDSVFFFLLLRVSRWHCGIIDAFGRFSATACVVVVVASGGGGGGRDNCVG